MFLLESLKRFLPLGATAYLIWLHGLLLWRRVVEQSLFEPGVLLRWVASVLLIGLVASFSRRGLDRRKLVGLALLGLLLHAGLPAPIALGSSAEQSGRLLFVLPLLGSLVGPARSWASALVRRRTGSLDFAFAPASRPGPALSSGWTTAHFGRPPPA